MRRLLVILLSLTLLMTSMRGVVLADARPDGCRSGFVDLPDAHLACLAVAVLHRRGIVNGYGSEFRPDRPVTRAEFAKLLILALGLPPQPDLPLPFMDTAGHWATDRGYLQAAVALGAITGYPDERFRPDQPVTRAEAVKLAAAALGLEPLAASGLRYPDLVPGDWYSGWAAAAHGSGLIGSGALFPLWTGGAFAGAVPATRAEAALLLANLDLLKHLVGEGSVASAEAVSREVFELLDDEARSAFLHHLKAEANAGRSDLLDYHQDLGFGDPYRFARLDADVPLSFRAERRGALEVLGRELRALDLPAPVQYSLLAVGAGLVAAGTGVTLLAGTALAVIFAAGTGVVLLFYWAEVSGKWDQITAAFEAAFESMAGSIQAAFTTLQLDLLSKKIGRGVVPRVYADSAAKHLEEDCVRRILHRRIPVEAYYSPTGKLLLLVLTIPGDLVSRCRADEWLNIEKAVPRTYETVIGQPALSQYSLLVLYDASRQKVFHAHLRHESLMRRDIEYLRYKNHLTVRLLPWPVMTEPRYNTGWVDGVGPRQTLK